MTVTVATRVLFTSEPELAQQMVRRSTLSQGTAAVGARVRQVARYVKGVIQAPLLPEEAFLGANVLVSLLQAEEGSDHRR